VEHLDVEDLLVLVQVLDAGPVRDVGLLDAAAARARATVMGQDAYPTLEQKAGALLHSLVRNHALVDGNKRLGLLGFVTFLRLNGHAAAFTQDDAFDLVMAVAEGRCDVDDVAAWLERHARP